MISQLLREFLEDWYGTNQDMFQKAFAFHGSPHPFLPVDYHRTYQYLVYLTVTIMIVFMSSYLIIFWCPNQSFIKLIVITILNILLVLVVPIVQAKGVNIFLGVFNFSFFMGLQGALFKHDRLQASDLNSFEQKYPKMNMFWDIVICTLLVGLPYRATIQCIGHFPTFATHLHGIGIILVSDVCNYLLQEYLPAHFPNSVHLPYLKSLVGCLWTVSALEFAYWLMNIGGDLVGNPLSRKYLHKNPLLSTSMTEFWSVNWNPIVGKLLQDCFYLPVLSMSIFPTWFAAIICFAGSGLFHGIPTIITTESWDHGFALFQFFCCQGLAVALETIILPKALLRDYALFAPKAGSHTSVTNVNNKLVRPKPPVCACAKETTIMNNDRCIQCSQYRSAWNETKSKFWIEVLFLTFIISSGFFFLEDAFANVGVSCLMIASGAMSIPAIIYYHYIQATAKKSFYMRMIGWSWVTLFLLLTMPLFVNPMMAALGMFFNRSYFIGPLVRLVSRCYNDRLYFAVCTISS